MTEPRPRLTNTIGNVQQTSVVSDDSKPTIAASWFRIHDSLQYGTHDDRVRRFSRWKSDEKREGVKVGRIVRPNDRDVPRSAVRRRGRYSGGRSNVERNEHGGHADLYNGCCGNVR